MAAPSDHVSPWASLPFRSSELEWLDDVHVDQALLRQNLAELELLNRLLGGHQSLLRGFQRALRFLPKRRLRVVDVGCGGGDGVRLLARWCAKRQLPVEFIGLDFNPTVIELAQAQSRSHANVRYVQGDAFGEVLDSLAPDLVTATLFCHHFPTASLGSHLAKLLAPSAALLISDLHRHPIAHAGFRALGRVARFCPMTRHDGAVSIRRGFKRRELEALIAPLGARHTSIRWAFAFRFEVLLVR
jgi:2-polyprenyl-3-methyl-5-hydroxy-6-metoxy-1,4-benzoquinol methylase